MAVVVLDSETGVVVGRVEGRADGDGAFAADVVLPMSFLMGVTARARGASGTVDISFGVFEGSA